MGINGTDDFESFLSQCIRCTLCFRIRKVLRRNDLLHVFPNLLVILHDTPLDNLTRSLLESLIDGALQQDTTKELRQNAKEAGKSGVAFCRQNMRYRAEKCASPQCQNMESSEARFKVCLVEV